MLYREVFFFAGGGGVGEKYCQVSRNVTYFYFFRIWENNLWLFFISLRLEHFFTNGIFFIFTTLHNSPCPWSFLMSFSRSFLALLYLWDASTRILWNIHHLKYSRARHSFNYNHFSFSTTILRPVFSHFPWYISQTSACQRLNIIWEFMAGPSISPWAKSNQNKNHTWNHNLSFIRYFLELKNVPGIVLGRYAEVGTGDGLKYL